MAVVMPVKLVKPEKHLNLPYTETNKQNFNIKVLGGSGSYVWQSSNSSVAQVDQHGNIRVVGLGECQIKVGDQNSKRNKDEIKVHVKNIGKTSFIEAYKEFMVGEESPTLIVSRDDQGSKFSRCDHLVYKLQSKSTEVLTRQEKISKEFMQELVKEISIDSLMMNLVTDNKTFLHDFLKLSDFAAFLENGIIKEQDLLEIFNQYKNYGLCKLVFSQSIQTSRNILEATPVDSTGSTGFQKQDFLDSFLADTSNLDMEYFDLQTKGIGLTHLTSYTWKLSRGPNRWEFSNQAEKIQYSITATLPTQYQRFLESELTKDEDGAKQWKLRCKNDSGKLEQFSLILQAKNQKTNLLPKPLSFSTSILIKCGPPASLKLFTIRTDKHKLSTLNFSGSKLRDNSGELSATSNQKLELQSWVFDEKGQPFFNFTSLQFDWTGPNLDNNCQLSNLEKGLGNSKLLEIGSDPKEFTLKVSSQSHLENPAKFQNIEDTLKIKLVKNITVLPENYAILHHPDARGKLTIVGGSGKFKITAINPALADVIYDPTTNTIQIIPKALGNLEIDIQDAYSPLSIKKVVRIVKPHSMALKISDKFVESGHSTIGTIEVFDDQNYRLDDDQVKLIDIGLIAMPTNRRNSEEAVAIKKSTQTKYSLLANCEKFSNDLIQLTAYGKLSGFGVDYQINASESFVCLSKPTPDPTPVLVAVGCTFAIYTQSHDYFGIDTKFEIQDPTIIKLAHHTNSHAVFESLKKGQTSVEVSYIERANGSRKIIKTVVPVTVDLVDSISISPADGRKVHTNAPVRFSANAHVHGKKMTSAWCEFTLEWSTDKSSGVEIEKLEDIKQDGKRLGLSFYNDQIAANIVGRTVGEAEIKVKLIVKSNGSTLSASRKIFFIEPISIDLPLYIGSKPCPLCSTLLMPPNSLFYLSQLFKKEDNFETNFDIRSGCAECAKNQVVKLGDHKRLESGSNLGFANFQIVDSKNSINTRMLNVEVANLHSLVVENSSKSRYLSVGRSVYLKVSVQDELGRIFADSFETFRNSIFSTNPKVVSVSTTYDSNARVSHLKVTGKSRGEALIYVRLENTKPLIFDVFKVTVDNFVQTFDNVKVHVGGEVSFKTYGIQSDSDQGWKSSNPQILAINPKTGTASGISPGKVTVSYESNVKVEYEVEVFRVTSMKLNHGSPLELTNLDSDLSTHNISINFNQDDRHLLDVMQTSGIVENNLNLECSTDQKNWFSTRVEISEDIGSSHKVAYCVIEPVKNYPEGFAPPEKVYVTAKLRSNSSKSSQEYDVQGQVEVRYKWGFSVSSTEYLDSKVKISFDNRLS